MKEKPKVGDKAPDFTMPVTERGQDGEKSMSLSDYVGKKLVMYFYPKDDTPGCTKQACAIRDDWEELSKKANVLGVSADSIQKHDNFIDKFSLPFALASDEDKKTLEDYGVWVEKSMYGKTYMGIERSTFVIDEKGIIIAVFSKVNPTKHLDQVLEYL